MAIGYEMARRRGKANRVAGGNRRRITEPARLGRRGETQPPHHAELGAPPTAHGGVSKRFLSAVPVLG